MSIQTAIIGTPFAGTSTVFTMLDILASVGRDWEFLHGLPLAEPRFQASLRTCDGAPYWDINGRKITPDACFDETPSPDLVIIPDLHIDPSEPLPEELRSIARWMKQAYERGATVASVCSGAILLGETGVLNGKEATTHWAYADMLSQHCPDVRVCRERILIAAGDGHRIITAGGASAWQDLMLYLIGRYCGVDVARQIAKIYLIEPHGDSQLNYASLTAGRQHNDRLIADAQHWAAQHYDTPSPVAAMAALSQLTERGFHRRFKRVTGQSPIDYIQTLRVEEAKQLLEASTLSIEEISTEVGYTEPSSFRTAFRKRVGMSASAYRRKWQAIAEVR